MRHTVVLGNTGMVYYIYRGDVRIAAVHINFFNTRHEAERQARIIAEALTLL